MNGEDELAVFLGHAKRAFGKAPYEPLTLVQQGYGSVAVRGTDVVGGGLALSFGQYLGGRVVPSGGTAWLSVAPQARGAGLGGRIMADKLSWLQHHRGAAIACMWSPATGMYRKWGWEVGAVASSFKVNPAELPHVRTELDIVPVEPADYDRYQRAAASAWDGPMDRPDWWYRWKSRCTPALHSIGIVDGGTLHGYASFVEEPCAPWGFRVVVHDFWCARSDLLTTLLAALTTRSPQAREIEFRRSVLSRANDLLWMLPQYAITDMGWYPWMVKILDLPLAVRLRGWSAAVAGEIELALREPGGKVVNQVLTFKDGEAAIEPGGSGRLECSVGTFASWYVGALPMRRARAMGKAAGADADVEAMDALVAGRECWLPESY
jgi:predicted acetyltransferase